MKTKLVPAFILLFYKFQFVYCTNNTTGDCVAHGRYSLYLICLSCFQLDLGEIIEAYCKRCCSNTTIPTNKPNEKKYDRAVLEFCFCKAPVYPEITRFVNSDQPAKFPNLKIKEVLGVDPALKLMDKNGTEVTIYIEGWTADAIRDYLLTHLEREKIDNSIDETILNIT